MNVLGVLLGVAAAGGSSRLVLAAGLAATFAESISMAAVAFTSKRAEADLFRSEAARERRHLRTVPALEREEIRALYRRKGFEGPLLERIVETITANEDVWVAVMMSEEHGLAPVSSRRALGASLIVGASAVVGSFVPLLPFFFAPIRVGIWISIALAGVTLFAFGAFKARWTVGVPWKSGLELAGIGLTSALAGYGIGALFGA
ncbi:MAG TPA: VIT1/CCC1 transporter family protein [Myxococcales bacterium]|nr:VIT1/CCC1 transporter family protein [Myxococcales bacterium]